MNKQSIGKGILVVMNEEILTANDVAKTNTTNFDAFKAPNYGKLGTVNLMMLIIIKVLNMLVIH